MSSFFEIIDARSLASMEERIAQIENKTEKQLRRDLLDSIIDRILDCDVRISEYDYEQHCNEVAGRGIDFYPIKKRSAAAKWSRLFASGISKEDKKRVCYRQYRWHLFSYKLLDSLCGDDARDAFENCPKSSVCVFFQLSEDAYELKHAELLRAADFEAVCMMDKADVYVFDPESKWTYIHTHEDSCGPYFYRIK